MTLILAMLIGLYGMDYLKHVIPSRENEIGTYQAKIYQSMGFLGLSNR